MTLTRRKKNNNKKENMLSDYLILIRWYRTDFNDGRDEKTAEEPKMQSDEGIQLLINYKLKQQNEEKLNEFSKVQRKEK